MFQSLGTLHYRRHFFLGQARFTASQGLTNGLLVMALQLLIRAQGEGHTVWVVQQLAANQAGHIFRIFDFLTQAGQHRLQIQQLHRITTVHHGRNSAHDQLQAVGKTVTGNLALMQFKLMQDGLKPLLTDSLSHHFLQSGFNQRFQLCPAIWLAAFNAAHKGHFPIGIFKAAHGRWRVANIRGFQGPHQWRGTVFQQYGRQ